MSLEKVDNKVGRLAVAYEYLKSIGKAHKQQDIAEQMSTDKANVSRAMNGDARYLTNRFLSRFNMAYGNIFNLDWLLRGVGVMCCSDISDEELQRQVDEANAKSQQIGDNSSHNTQIMTENNDVVIGMLRDQLAEKNEEIKFLRSLIAEMNQNK